MGNKNSVYITIGGRGHARTEREPMDFYATDPVAIDKFVANKLFVLPKKIWECSCGMGHLSKRLKTFGHEVYSTDIINRGYGDGVVDFLSFEADAFWEKIGGVDCILTNPPYRLATEFILQALRLLDDGGYACFFLKTTALESKARYEKIFRHQPPKYVFQFIERVLCAKGGDFEYSRKHLGSGAQAFAWYVWEKGFKGKPILEWI